MKVKIDMVTVIVLFVIFILLKFMGLITWSWFWVLSPLWIFATFITFLVLLIILYTVIRIVRDLIKQILYENGLKHARRKDK